MYLNQRQKYNKIHKEIIKPYGSKYYFMHKRKKKHKTNFITISIKRNKQQLCIKRSHRKTYFCKINHN